jgi:pimeloyl-ACP methyl ester carboxylesterase
MRSYALILAACAAGTLTWSAAANSRPAAQTAAAEERLPHISIQAMGEGTPVVLVPGLATPRAVWDGIAPKLAKDHRVILVQVNGFAGDNPGANLQPAVLDGVVAELHSYLVTHHLGRVAMIGHSMGGLAGLMFAKAHPDSLDRLMLVDALPFFGVLMDPAATAESLKPTAQMMRAKIASAYGKPVDAAAIEDNVKGLALKPESIARMKQWGAAADMRVTSQVLYEDLTTDVRPQLHGIATPITVVVPWSDKAFGEEVTLAFYKRQYAAAPRVSFVGIGDAAHFVMLDQPEKFATAVEAFVK